MTRIHSGVSYLVSERDRLREEKDLYKREVSRLERLRQELVEKSRESSDGGSAGSSTNMSGKLLYNFSCS